MNDDLTRHQNTKTHSLCQGRGGDGGVDLLVQRLRGSLYEGGWDWAEV
jgi:hypothetical protein